MLGKYHNWPRFAASYLNRELLRLRLRNAVSWTPPTNLEPGCTAIIGMCHRLPGVLNGNLRCLLAAAWPELRRIVIVVDAARGSVSPEVEAKALSMATSDIAIDIFYYSTEQARLSEQLCQPWVFSWLSWSIALSHCRTWHALIQDYDALVFGDVLRRRYETFVESGAAIQGIRWYTGNGIEVEDRLATTFEAFVDVAWIRSRHPLAGFHKIARRGGVSRDYDTLLHLQHVHTPPERRTTMEMPDESLVHPSQMIHQYTMARRHPGASQACAALPMIPFFDFLSGNERAIAEASERLERRRGTTSKLLGDDTQVNLDQLELAHVDWDLKQMVQACMLSNIEPFAELYRYGQLLYEVCGATRAQTWAGDFTEVQREWIERCRTAASLDTTNSADPCSNVAVD